MKTEKHVHEYYEKTLNYTVERHSCQLLTNCNTALQECKNHRYTCRSITKSVHLYNDHFIYSQININKNTAMSLLSKI